MKKFKKFMPLFKNVFAMFIKDLIDALIGFLFGAAIEAIINLELMKGIVFIIIYFILRIMINDENQNPKNVQNKYIPNIKNNRGIKIEKQKIFYIIIGGSIITYIVLFYKFSLLSLLIITCLFIGWLLKHKFEMRDKNYKLLISNLINYF